MLVHVHIFSTAKPFVTKLGMVINHYEAVSCKRLVCCLQGHVALKVYVIKCNCFCYVFWTTDPCASKLNLILYHKPVSVFYFARSDCSTHSQMTQSWQRLKIWVNECPDNIKTFCQSYVLYNWFLFATVTLPWPCAADRMLKPSYFLQPNLVCWGIISCTSTNTQRWHILTITLGATASLGTQWGVFFHTG